METEVLKFFETRFPENKVEFSRKLYTFFSQAAPTAYNPLQTQLKDISQLIIVIKRPSTFIDNQLL